MFEDGTSFLGIHKCVTYKTLLYPRVKLEQKHLPDES